MKIDLRRHLVHAITDAQYEYMEMTGKREFRAVEKSIPEKVLEVFAAKKCWDSINVHGYHVVQEYTWSSINHNIKTHLGDRRAKKYANSTKRFDIAILDERQKLYGLVEIKRKGALKDNAPSGDIMRLREIKKYILDRTGHSVKTYFAYAGTMHYRDDGMYKSNLSIEKNLASEKFGNEYYMNFDKNNSHKLADNDLHFCFGAVCGAV